MRCRGWPGHSPSSTCWWICRPRRRSLRSTHSLPTNSRSRSRIAWLTNTCRASVCCTATCSDSPHRIIWRWVVIMVRDDDRLTKADIPMQAMSDFHLLLYLFGLDCFGTKLKTQLTPLLDAVRTQDKKLAEKFMRGDTWSTLEHLIGAHSGSEWVLFYRKLNILVMCSFPRL